MSKEPINLSSFHPGNVDPIPKGQDVSRFKDPLAGRVVAASPKLTVYTLKDASKLRVVASPGAAAGGTAPSQSVEIHSAPITQISFMPGRHNVIASCSEAELLVWMVEGSEAHISLKFNANKIAGFCWTHAESPASPSNLAILTADSGEILTVKAGALFQANMQDETGTLKSTPHKVITIEKSQTTVAGSGLKSSKAYPAIAEAFPALVAAADATSAVVCRNGVSTKWKPAGDSRENQNIVGIVVSHSPRPNTVVIATTNTVTFWDLSLDAPVKLLDVDVPLKVLAVAAASTRIVLVVTGKDETEPKKIQIASVGVNTRKGSNNNNNLLIAGMTLYDVELDVSFEASSCHIFANDRSEVPVALLDTGKALSFYNVARIVRPRQQNNASPAANAGGATSSASVPAATNDNNTNVNLSIPAPKHPNLAAHLASLTNNSRLPIFTAASGEQSADFDKQLEPFTQRLNQNANRVRSKANDLATVLPVDHEALLTQALDAQRDNITAAVRNAVAKELVNFSGSSSGAAAKNVQLDEETSAQISEVVVRGVSDGIVENIARGISDALNIQLARRVDGLVQSAIQRYVKRMKRSQEKEGNKNAEGMAKEILDAARSELENKQKDYGMQLLFQLQQLNRPATDALQKMQKIIQQQQQFIDKFCNSGVLEDVQRLRDEVANLRASAGASVAAPSKASILARARDAFAAGNVDNGLQWVLQQNDPLLTLGLLTSVGDFEKVEDLVATHHEDVPVQRWERVATDLAQIVDGEHLKTTLKLIEIVVAETKAAKNARVAEVLRGYVETWKKGAGNTTLPADVRDSLRDISVALR